MDEFDAWGDRCRCCGCFLGVVDTSTESGEDYDFVCNSKRCKSNNPLYTDETDY